MPAVLRVWGVWAVIAGITQLTVGLVGRRMGGQWSTLASGINSALAGVSFFVQAGSDGATLMNLAGYAFLDGPFFLASALSLNFTHRQS